MTGEDRRHAAIPHDEEANAPLRLLVSGVAHQLRNPLFGMSAAIDALELRLGPAADRGAFFDVLRGQIARVGAVVQDLIDYAEPAPLALGRGSLTEAVHEALGRCVTLAERRAITIEVTSDPPACSAAIDAPRLTLAVERLLEDALEQAPVGGHVAVAMQPLVRSGLPWFECSIEDDGPSFTDDGLRRAFEPFFPRRSAAGGLGLAIAHCVVIGHGGELTVANSRRGGARMTLRLPCLPAGSEPEPPSDSAIGH